jgi:hypothetical protein
MNWLETVKTVVEIISYPIIAFFTVALFYATWILAKQTKIKDAHDEKQRQTENIKRCIVLAGSIIGLNPTVLSANFSGELVQMFNELLNLSESSNDSETKRLLEIVASRFSVARLAPPVNELDPGLLDSLTKLQDRLRQEIIELQRKLGNYHRG